MAQVALYEQEEDERLGAVKMALEEFEERLNNAVSNAGSIWNSAYQDLFC
jgi:hypothetical protein